MGYGSIYKKAQFVPVLSIVCACGCGGWGGSKRHTQKAICVAHAVLCGKGGLCKNPV